MQQTKYINWPYFVPLHAGERLLASAVLMLPNDASSLRLAVSDTWQKWGWEGVRGDRDLFSLAAQHVLMSPTLY